MQDLSKKRTGLPLKGTPFLDSEDSENEALLLSLAVVLVEEQLNVDDFDLAIVADPPIPPSLIPSQSTSISTT